MADEVISRRRMLEDVGLIAGGALPGSAFTLVGALSVATLSACWPGWMRASRT